MRQDFKALRELFPALGRVVWLNWATSAPGATPVLEAMRSALAEWEDGAFSWRRWEADAELTRPLFAQVVGGEANCIALMTSLSHAAATVANSLPPGRVVVGAREFRSNLFPWLALARRGFDVFVVPARDEQVGSRAIARAVDERTVLVAVTEVQSSDGFRVDLEPIADRCRSVGARLFVNLTQSVGALRFDIARSGADFVAAHGYKWLLCPRGATWLWVRPDRRAELEPLDPSWKTPPDPHSDYYGGPYEAAPSGRGLDSSIAWLPWTGARAALELVCSLDAGAVESRCLGLAGEFRTQMTRRGFDVVSQELPSQVVAVRVPDPRALDVRLAERGVVAAVRDAYLRIGFHAFNDESDLGAALDAIDAA
jgi:selenocysteine lyase/cysteine desulfurase